MDQDLAGKTILITGASSGIGLEASVILARRGAEVVMVARDPERGARALADVKARSGSDRVSLMRADLASLADVRALAASFRESHSRLDVLVNNAGGVSDRRRTTVDGYEQTFAVNHLAGFLLTNLLLDLLRASAPSRVVVVASVGHFRGDMPFDNLQYENGGYAIFPAYCRSKLANVLFTNELARRLSGAGVTVSSLHPGSVATNIWSGAPWFARPLVPLAKLFMISPARGAEAIVHAAAAPGVETGTYFDRTTPRKPSRLARDEALAKRLWEVSERLTANPG